MSGSFFAFENLKVKSANRDLDFDKIQEGIAGNLF